VFFALL
jgi:hypothetical protein